MYEWGEVCCDHVTLLPHEKPNPIKSWFGNKLFLDHYVVWWIVLWRDLLLDLRPFHVRALSSASAVPLHNSGLCVLHPDVCMCACQDEQRGLVPRVNSTLQQLECGMLIWKLKSGVYVRVDGLAAGCSVFLWALRHGTIWHLAFPHASHAYCVPLLCPWNTFFYLLLFCRTLHFLSWCWDWTRSTRVNWVICIDVMKSSACRHTNRSEGLPGWDATLQVAAFGETL